MALVELVEFLGVFGGGTEEESVVHMAFGLCDFDFFLEGLTRGSGGHAVGHVEDGGDASGCGSLAFSVEVGLVGKSGVAEVNVVVDDAGEDIATGGIEHLVGGKFGFAVEAFEHFGYAFVVDDDAAYEFTAFVDDGGVLDVNTTVHGTVCMSWYMNTEIRGCWNGEGERVCLLFRGNVAAQHAQI